MAHGIYKSGQGYYTRLVSAIALGLLAALGAYWLWGILEASIAGDKSIYFAATGAVVWLAFFSIVGYYLIGRKQNVVDFMVATEGEMKKVNWSSRREIVGSTWAVIGLTILIALLCFVFDRFFQAIFQGIGVLET